MTQYDFKVLDENGNRYVYQASDMRMALVVHHMRRGTDVVKAIRRNQPAVSPQGDAAPTQESREK